MIVLPNRFAFLCTPRTGSRAIVTALRPMLDAKESKTHHVHPEEVLGEIKALGGSTGLPLFTLIRDPYEQTLSWFGHAILRHEPERSTEEDFTTFIEQYNINWYFMDRLNVYASLNPEVFPFHKYYLQTSLLRMVKRSNFLSGRCEPANRVMRIGGGTTPPMELLTKRTRKLVEERFPEDIKLWNEYNGKT